jgi:hypothetical protein
MTIVEVYKIISGNDLQDAGTVTVFGVTINGIPPFDTSTGTTEQWKEPIVCGSIPQAVLSDISANVGKMSKNDVAGYRWVRRN